MRRSKKGMELSAELRNPEVLNPEIPSPGGQGSKEQNSRDQKSGGRNLDVRSSEDLSSEDRLHKDQNPRNRSPAAQIPDAQNSKEKSNDPRCEIERIPAGQLTQARLVEMVFPEQTNHYGTLFGGQALALMDKAAFVVASRYARRSVVTASSERCDFHVPVRQGQLVELVAKVVDTGKTSMTVEVDLFSEDLLSGDRQLATRGRFVLVGLDAHGRPTPVPGLSKTSS